jgi:hypothetical protein
MLPHHWIEYVDDEQEILEQPQQQHGYSGAYDDEEDAILNFASGTGSPETTDPAAHGGGGGGRGGGGGGGVDGLLQLDGEDANEMRLAMRGNPRYPALLSAYFACRAVGADPRAAAALERQHAALLTSAAGIEAARSSGGPAHGSDGTLQSRPNSPHNGAGAGRGNAVYTLLSRDVYASMYGDDLDEFMSMFTLELQAYARDLRGIYDEADSLCREFEARVAGISLNINKGQDPTADGAAKGRGAKARGAARGGGGGGGYAGSLAEDAPAHSDEQEEQEDEEDEEEEHDGDGDVKEEDDDDDEEDEDETMDATAWVNKQRQRVSKKGRGGGDRPAKAPKADPDAADDSGGGGGGVDNREEDLRNSLKRKYGSSILSLKEEFLRKRKKGKLPQTATVGLLCS